MPTFDVSRAGWGARAPRQQRARDTFDHVEVHHTVVPDQGQALSRGNLYTVRGIQNNHMDTNGWNDIFYNAIVTPDGTVFEGRADTEDHAFRLCFVGNFQSEEPTEAQLASLRRAVAEVGGEIDTHTWRAAGTRFASSCPGKNMIEIVQLLNANQGTSNMVALSKDCTRLYTAILGREPEPAGVAFWNAEMQAGRRNYVDVAVEFLAVRFAAADAAEKAVYEAVRSAGIARVDTAQVAAAAKATFYAELEKLAELAALAKEAEPS